MNRLRVVVACAVLAACECVPVPPLEDGGVTGGGSATTGGGSATGGGATGGGSATGGGATTGGGSATGGGGGDVDAGVPELLVVTPTPPVTWAEGSQITITVQLTAQPAAAVTASVTAGDQQLVLVSPASLTFTPGNWNVPQEVTLASLADQNLVGGSTDVTIAAPNFTAVVVPVTVTDPDVQALVLAPANVVQVNEGGTATVSVSLAFEPVSAVTVTATTADANLATVTSGLSFTPANFSTPQPLTLTGVADADALDAMTTLIVSSTGLPSATLTVEVHDDDALGIDFGVTSLTVPETGGGFVSVRLTAQPAANVTVNITSSDPAIISVNTPMVQFTPANWNVGQMVFYSSLGDDDVVDAMATLTGSAAGLADRTVPVTVDDTDVVALVVPIALNVNEGASTPLSVRLTRRPPSPVVVSLAPSDAARLQLVPAMLTFTTANALTPQNVALNALHDDDADAEQLAITTTLGASTADTVVNVIDDDTQALVVMPTTVTVAEEGTANIPVRLAFRPAGNVLVTASSLDLNAVQINTASLTFTPANYATAQNLQIAGVADFDLVTDTTTVRVQSGGLTTVDVTANVTDNDTQTILANVSGANINEGSSTPINVSLGFEPASGVTVSVAIPGASANPTSLSFNAANYSTPQLVTLSLPIDLDRTSSSTTLSLSSASAPTLNIPVTLTDRTSVFGFASVSGSSVLLANGAVFAFPITISTSGEQLIGYGAVSSGSTGQLQFALYSDSANAPANLLAGSALGSPLPLMGTSETGVANTALAAGNYWLVFRGAASANLVSSTTAPTVRRCIRTTSITDINTPWPATFGASTCANAAPMAVYALTWR